MLDPCITQSQCVAPWAIVAWTDRLLETREGTCFMKDTCAAHARQESLLIKVEVWDGCGVATRVVTVGVVGEQRVLRGAAVHGVR